MQSQVALDPAVKLVPFPSRRAKQKIELRPLVRADRPALVALIEEAGTFHADEQAVALELVDDALRDVDGEYWVRVALIADRIVGYVCFGDTPMTQSTWDLFWIVTSPSARRLGVATALVCEMERMLSAKGVGRVRIETSQSEGYEAAQRLYSRLGYREVGRIADFYRRGDDLITFCKTL